MCDGGVYHKILQAAVCDEEAQTVLCCSLKAAHNIKRLASPKTLSTHFLDIYQHTRTAIVRSIGGEALLGYIQHRDVERAQGERMWDAREVDGGLSLRIG